MFTRPSAGAPMKPFYDHKAAKQTVSLTLNSDLYALAKRCGINASQIAEQALAQEVARLKTEQLKVEVRRDIEALDAYESTHGSFPEMVREHYRDASDDNNP
jgi:post-segregation antitoxin (ccd killing protein)